MQLDHVRLTSLLLALICFALPWFEIRCNMPDGNEVVVSQSGFEAAYGGSTTRVNGELVPEERQPPEHRERAPEPAWLLAVYGGALLLALLVSQLMSSGNARWLGTTLLSGLAAGVLIVQIAMGFPLLKAVPDDSAEYTPWYWLAIAATIVAPVASLCERVRLSPESSTKSKPHPELDAWEAPADDERSHRDDFLQ